MRSGHWGQVNAISCGPRGPNDPQQSNELPPYMRWDDGEHVHMRESSVPRGALDDMDDEEKIESQNAEYIINILADEPYSLEYLSQRPE